MAGFAGRGCAKLARPGRLGAAEEIHVQWRETLLIVLLAVPVPLYASIAADSGPGIIAGQKAQAERLKDLDEEVPGVPGAEPGRDGQ